MIIDSLWMFTGASTGIGNSDGKTDSPTTGAQSSSNIVDIGELNGIPVSAVGGGGGRDLGIGDDPSLKLYVVVTTALTGGTSIVCAFQGAPDAGSNTPGTYVTYESGPVVVEASLIAGTRLMDAAYPRPAPGSVPPRYVRLLFTSVGTHGAGAVEAFVCVDRFDQIEQTNAVLGGYPPGITINN